MLALRLHQFSFLLKWAILCDRKTLQGKKDPISSQDKSIPGTDIMIFKISAT
jgi:hypothetical protein